jgi:hypothetical protein
VYEDNSHLRVRHLSQVMPACISYTNLIVHIKLSPDRNSLSHTHTRSLPRRHTEPAARKRTPHQFHTTGFPQIQDTRPTRGLYVQEVDVGGALYGYRVNMANTRQSKPDSGLGFRVIDFGLFSSTGRGSARAEDAQGTTTQSHRSPSVL